MGGVEVNQITDEGLGALIKQVVDAKVDICLLELRAEYKDCLTRQDVGRILRRIRLIVMRNGKDPRILKEIDDKITYWGT